MHKHHKKGFTRTVSRKVSEYLNDNPGSQSIPTWGDVFPVAIYWVFVDVGTPPVQFPVAIDTGSDDLDIPMVGCATCISAPPNAVYDVSKSSTGSTSCPFGCTFSNSYQTCDLSDPSAVCTISGNYYQDMVTFSKTGITPVSVVFGGINFQTSNFDQFKNIDGVIGLAGGANSQDVFESLVDAGSIGQDVFSMCYHQGSKSNGTFTLGGIDSRLYHGNIVYTTNVGGDEEYDLQLTDIQINGVTVDGTSGQLAIMDSGTNVVLVTDQMFQSMNSIFLNNCSANPLVGICTGITNGTLFDGACFPLTGKQMAAYPPIEFRLKELTLTLEPEDYLIYVSELGMKCLGIRNTGSFGLFIVGDTLLQEYYTVLDRTKNLIGFAPVNRDNCGSI
jgi:hypothetical protein